MVQTQSLTMLGYVGSSCADNRLASSFTVWHQFFFHSMFFRVIHFLERGIVFENMCSLVNFQSSGKGSNSAREQVGSPV